MADDLAARAHARDDWTEWTPKIRSLPSQASLLRSRLRARGAPEAKNGTVSLVLTDGISLIGTRRENQKFPVVPDAVCSSKSDTSTCK